MGWRAVLSVQPPHPPYRKALVSSICIVHQSYRGSKTSFEEKRFRQTQVSQYYSNWGTPNMSRIQPFLFIKNEFQWSVAQSDNFIQLFCSASILILSGRLCSFWAMFPVRTDYSVNEFFSVKDYSVNETWLSSTNLSYLSQNMHLELLWLFPLFENTFDKAAR